MKSEKWEYTDSPSGGQGWYAIHYCWEANEGSFTDAVYYDGEKLSRDSLPILEIAGPFKTEAEANLFIDEYDVTF